MHTHRDPLKVIASTASLASFLHRLARDDTSIAALAPGWAEWLVLGDDRSVDGREDGTVPPGRAVDVHYRDFMAAPFDAIAAVYDRIGVPFTDVAEQAMKQFLADNAADKHGVHRYTFSATGLDVETMRRRTARYERYFNVVREELG